MTTTLAEMRNAGNIVAFDDATEYERYFRHLKRVFGRVIEWYRLCPDLSDAERTIVEQYAQRFLTTIEALAVYYTFHPSHRLQLDLNESGYPHNIAFMEMANDVHERNSRLERLRSEDELKRSILSQLLVKHIDPADLLWELGQREYLQGLEVSKIFMAFTPGEIQLLGTTTTRRRYLYTWGCFDSASNMPFVHIMLLEQDVSQQPLEPGTATYDEFVKVVRRHGKDVPQLALLAVGIDADLPFVHPKVIKRIRIGPITWMYSAECATKNPLLEPFIEYCGPDDHIIRMRHELLVSDRETAVKHEGFAGWVEGLIGPTIMRDVYRVDQIDAECSEQQATSISRSCIMPHCLLRHIDFAAEPFAHYGPKRYTHIAYEGETIYPV